MQRKTYIATRADNTVHVSVTGKELCPKRSQLLFNHSPNGFEWGYGGSGPAQLALAILLDLTNDAALSLKLHQLFKKEFIETAPSDGFILTAIQIQEWLLVNGKKNRSEPGVN
jgi:Family of unknown function (DUF6166)